jgi:hypothetical protein
MNTNHGNWDKSHQIGIPGVYDVVLPFSVRTVKVGDNTLCRLLSFVCSFVGCILGSAVVHLTRSI